MLLSEGIFEPSFFFYHALFCSEDFFIFRFLKDEALCSPTVV